MDLATLRRQPTYRRACVILRAHSGRVCPTPDRVHPPRRHRRIRWHEVRRYKQFSRGILLLPHERPGPIDVVWGLFVPWGRRREAVLAQFDFYLDPLEQA